MSNAGIDQNSKSTLIALSNANNGAIVPLWADPISHRLLVDIAGGISFEVPTGTVDGSNTAFTVVNTPQYIVVDGLIKRATDSAGNVHYTYSAGTITIADSAPPTQDILSFY